MKNKKEKTNIDFLRDILNGFAAIDSEKSHEGMEFLDAIQNEIWELSEEKTEAADELKKAEEEISDLRSTISNLEDNPDTEEFFVGLDTIYIGYQNRNLKIEQQVESFIQRLQRENSVVPA